MGPALQTHKQPMSSNQTFKNDLVNAINNVLTNHGYLPTARLELRSNGADLMMVSRTCTEAAGRARLEHAKILIETDYWKANNSFVHQGKRLRLLTFDDRDPAPWKATDGFTLIELTSPEMHAAIERYTSNGRPALNPRLVKAESFTTAKPEPKPAAKAEPVAAGVVGADISKELPPEVIAQFATWG